MHNSLLGYECIIRWDDGDINTYKIVDVSNNHNEIRYDTPFAQSLINKRVGDKITYTANGNVNTFILEKIFSPSLDECIKQRNLKNIYHFTNIENFISILKNGILSRDLLNKNNISYSHNDNDRIDGKTDCICCSLEYPNSKLSYTFVLNKRIALIIFEIDISILYNSVAYCSLSNAAMRNGSQIKPISEINDLFLGERNPALPMNYTTDQQAEILIKDQIPLNYIKKIYINNIQFMTRLEKSLSDNNLNIPIKYDTQIFYPRSF
ncbi:MAG: DarT ssDNA thymidine ADP-ribosyltransferase family protein [Clostridia bacterium]|nr:DarT ssDNA thymidine ADP-ribosyltransferase family protein [Clostridia bacterium]